MTAAQPQPDEAPNHKNQGDKLFSARKFQEATDEYRRATEIKPDYADAYLSWAEALQSQQKFAEASQKYETAFEKYQLHPESGAVYQKTLGNVLNDWGNALYYGAKYPQSIDKYEKASERYQKAAEQYAEKTDKAEACNAWGNLFGNWGNALYNQRDYSGAIEKYREAGEKFNQAITLNESNEATYRINKANASLSWGGALASQYQYEEAVEKLREAIRLNENNPYPYHNIASYAWKQGKYRPARELWAEARARYELGRQSAAENANADFFYYYGMIVHGIDADLVQAEQIYQQGLGLDPAHVLILSGCVELHLDQKDGGYADDRPEALPDATTAHWKAREKYLRAQRLLKERLEKEGEDAATLRLLGELLLKMEEHTEAEKKKYAEAESYLFRSLQKDPESAETYSDLGVLYSKREDTRRAAQYFEDALRRDVDNLGIWKNLAEAYFKSNQKEKAEAEYGKILAISADHVEAQIGLGEVCKAMGDDTGDPDLYEQAIAHFSEGITAAQERKGSKILKKKELAAAHYSAGYARVKLYEASKGLGDITLLQKAREDFEKCWALDQDNHKAKRAIEKLKKRTAWYSPQRLDRIGPWMILVPAVFLLVLGQFIFLVHRPKIEMTLANYIALTGVSLFFIVVGLSLPQILKLKFGSIELEKSAVEQIATAGPIGISK